MLLKRLSLLLLGSCLFAFTVAGDSLQDHPCLVTCSLASLGESSASCLASINDCLCQNATLAYQIGDCVSTTCSSDDVAYAKIYTRQSCLNVEVESRSGALIIYQSVLTGVGLLAVILRFASRWTIRKVWMDDWIILLTLFTGFASTAVSVTSCVHGTGKHWWKFNAEDEQLVYKLFYVSQALYIIFQISVKISILIFYLRIFKLSWPRLVTKILFVFTSAHCLAFFIASLLPCTPVAASWDESISGSCYNDYVFGLAGAICSIIDDIVIWILPIPQILSLTISWRQKVIICILMICGVFATMCSIIRVPYLVQLIHEANDPTWDTYNLIIWSISENQFALICACLVTYRPLVRYLRIRVGSVVSNPSNSSSKTSAIAQAMCCSSPSPSASTFDPENINAVDIGHGMEMKSLPEIEQT